MSSFPVMRYIIIAFYFIVFTTAPGCKNATSPFKPKMASITGVLSGADKSGFLIKGLEEYSGDFQSDGSFYVDMQIDEPGVFIFSSGRLKIPFFIKPGQKVELSANAKKPHDIQFSGDNIQENQYLLIHSDFKKTLPDNNYAAFYTQNESDFIKGVEERTQELVRHSQDYQKINGVFDSDFSDLLALDITFESALIKMNYPEYYQFFLPDSTLVLSETYDSFLQNIDTDDSDQLSVPNYHEFLPVFLDFTARRDTSSQQVSYNLKKYKKIDPLFSDNEVRSVLYLQLAEDMISTSIDDFNEIYDDFVKKNIQPEFKVKNLLQGFENKKHLLRGQKAPDGIFHTLDARDVSFNDFRGKVLYVDVWATWCGPCIREIPYLEKKQEQYRQRDVVFISISVDEEKGPWEYMVKDKKLKGQQWYAPGAWQSSLAQDYRITGIPRFIIIDREGHIFNAYAPRPSFDEFDQVMEDVLSETARERQ